MDERAVDEAAKIVKPAHYGASGYAKLRGYFVRRKAGAVELFEEQIALRCPKRGSRTSVDHCASNSRTSEDMCTGNT